MSGTSSKTTPVSWRLPNDLAAHVKAYAAANGVSASEAARTLLLAGLVSAGDGLSVQHPAHNVSQDSSGAVAGELAALRAQVSSLLEVQKASTITVVDAVRTAVAEQAVPALPPGVPEAEVEERVSAAAERARAEGAATELGKIASMGMLERRRYLKMKD